MTDPAVETLLRARQKLIDQVPANLWFSCHAGTVETLLDLSNPEDALHYAMRRIIFEAGARWWDRNMK